MIPYNRFSTQSSNSGNSGSKDPGPKLTSATSVQSGSAMISQWETLMRKYSSDRRQNEEKCISTLVDDIPCKFRPLATFVTGCKYEGTWDALGMSGYGIYTFPDGVVYEGEFEDNMFHGDGELRYPSGIILRGRWAIGTLIQRTLIFPDGVRYKETDWKYCKPPDRRFGIEMTQGLSNSEHILTAEQPPREIPPEMYDTGHGFYDPSHKTIYKYNDLSAIHKGVDDELHDWIINNCRRSPDVSIGPLPQLYNHWQEPLLASDVSPTLLSARTSEDSQTITSINDNHTPSTLWGKRMTSFRYNSKLILDAFRPERSESTADLSTDK